MPALPRKYSKRLAEIDSLIKNARKISIHAIWRSGQILVEIEQEGELKAQYGSHLLEHISEEMIRLYGAGYSVSNLKNYRQFYLASPKRQPAGELPWSHYVELMRVKDEKKRRKLERRAWREDLNRDQLRLLVKGQPLPKRADVVDGELVVKKLPSLKKPTGMKLGTVQVLEGEKGQKRVNLGFHVVRRVPASALAGLTVTDDLAYTYAAKVLEVIDGDTIDVDIELGLDTEVGKERLRLRGVNTPEVGTKEGDEIKTWLIELLSKCPVIVIRSWKCRADLHGRYVTDVFFKEGCGDPDEILKSGTWLNGLLLELGLAVRMD